MRRPWKRPAGAGRDDRAADARLRNAKALAGEARQVTAKLRHEIEKHEIEKNGFTELFQQAMGRSR